MNNAVVRTAVSVLAGMVAASLLIMLVELIAHAAIPLREGAAMPQALTIAVAAGWFFGSLLGALAAMRLSHRIMPGWMVGAIIAALSLYNTQSMPHPAWMVVAAVVLPLVAVLIAKALLRRQLTEAPRIAR